MAILKMGGLSTSIVGKIGGQVFQNGTYGTVIKNNRYKRSRQTSVNYKQRSRFAYLAAVGRNLSTEQRAEKTASGLLFTRPTKAGPNTTYDWFSLNMAFNGNLQTIGAPLVLGGFLPVTPPDIDGWAVGYESGTLNWEMSGLDDLDTPWYYVIEASGPVDKWAAFRGGRMKIIQTGVGVAGNIVIDRTNYNSVFGTIAFGQNLWFRITCVLSTTGQAGSPRITKADAQ